MVFQVSLNFDSAKKLWHQIYILTKKVIILRKIQVAVKTFAHHSLTISVWARAEKTCANESHEKELNIFTLQLLIYYTLELEILIGWNAGIVKTKWEK